MKKVAVRSKVQASTWAKRLENSQKWIESRMKEREVYADSLSLKTSVPHDAPDHIRQFIEPRTEVPILYRYVQWLKSMAAGDDPMVKFPRDDGTSPEHAEMSERLLLKVIVDDTRMLEEHRDGLTNLAWAGCVAFWYGFDANIVDMESMEAGGRSVAEILDRAVNGDVAARPGENHDIAAEAARAEAENAQTYEQAAALEAAAQSHDAADLAQDALPRDIEVTDHQAWCRRLVVGRDFLFDNTATSEHALPWVARRIILPLDVFKEDLRFKSSVRRKAKGTVLSHDQRHNIAGGDGQDLDDETKVVVVWEILDGVYQTRHLILTEEHNEEYAEASEGWPWLDERGESILPDTYPCVLSVPIKPATEGPERLVGIPLVQPGWSLQQEYNDFEEMELSSAKRHGPRQYVAHSAVDDEFLDDLTEGRDGAVHKLKDPTIDPRFAVVPIQFQGKEHDFAAVKGRVASDLSMALGFPRAEMTGAPIADTATQEQLGIGAGRSQAEDVLRQYEKDFARGAEIIRAFVRHYYPPEKVAAMLGPKASQYVEEWRTSSLDGDRLIIKFGSRAKAEDAVIRKQLIDAYTLLAQDINPLTGAPRWDTKPIVQRIIRDLTGQDPQELAEIEQLAMLEQMQAQQEQEGAKTSAARANPANENSSARRVRDSR